MDHHFDIKQLDPRITVDEAITWAGGTQTGLARRLGVSKQTVHDWVSSRDRLLPPLHAYRFTTLRALSDRAA